MTGLVWVTKFTSRHRLAVEMRYPSLLLALMRGANSLARSTRNESVARKNIDSTLKLTKELRTFSHSGERLLRLSRVREAVP